MSLQNTGNALICSPIIGTQDMKPLEIGWPSGQPNSKPLWKQKEISHSSSLSALWGLFCKCFSLSVPLQTGLLQFLFPFTPS